MLENFGKDGPFYKPPTVRNKKLNWNLPYLNDENKSFIMLMKESCGREVGIKVLNEHVEKPISSNATRDDLITQITEGFAT